MVSSDRWLRLLLVNTRFAARVRRALDAVGTHAALATRRTAHRLAALRRRPAADRGRSGGCERC